MPRGIRANNPGNIDYHKGTDWLGLDNPPSDGRFCRFTAPEYGIRVIAKLLLKYSAKYGLKTVRGLIGRWAPPVENDTGAYAKHVAARLGVGVDDPVDVTRPVVMRGLIEGIILHENGANPYTAAQIGEGMRRAGVG